MNTTIDLELEQQEQSEKHDEGYKGILGKKSNFLHFLRKYIAEPWVDKIDPDNMERVDKSFITQEYSKKDSDLIYKLQINGEDVYFYVLMELQSDVDFTMPFRLLRYMVELLHDIFKNTEEKIRERKGFRLPAVVPIVLYNGDDNWTAVRSYKEYTDNFEIFGENIINFTYLLFDLNRTDDETIASTRKVLDIVFAFNKFKPDKVSYEEILSKIIELTAELEAEEIIDLFNWIKHIHFKGKPPVGFEGDFREFVVKGENSMTHTVEIMRDRWEANLLKRGRLEAAIENAIEMIKEGLPFDMIKRVTQLPDEELNKIWSNG